MDGKRRFVGGSIKEAASVGGASRPLRLCVALLFALAASLAVVGVFARGAGSQENGAVVPLERAHAHNDYEHDRPLFDALDSGFKSVEADVFGKPVVLVHGDTHTFRIDKPLSDSQAGGRILNFTRVETVGSPDAHWSALPWTPANPASGGLLPSFLSATR